MTTPFQSWLEHSNWPNANQDSVDMARDAWNQAVADTVAKFWDGNPENLSLKEAVALCDSMHSIREPEPNK